MWTMQILRMHVVGPHIVRLTIAELVANQALSALFVVVDLPVAQSMWIALLPGGAVIKGIRVVCGPLARLASPSSSTPTKGRIMLRSRPGSNPHPLRAVGVLTALVVGLTLSTTSASVAVAGSSDPAVRMSADPVKTQIEKADAALARARTRIKAHRFMRAVDALSSARLHTVKANAAAKELIGAPPTDPESDDPPGPPAVLSALRLDYRMSTGTTALFDGQRKPEVVHALRRLVNAAQARRDVVLDAVIALPDEGEGADYSDGMADSLGMYGREVTAISTALHNFTLTSSGRTGLTNALARAQATKTKVDRAFGGGERPVH